MGNGIAWTAGFFEGEGYIGLDKRGFYPYLGLGNSDKSMIDQVR